MNKLNSKTSILYFDGHCNLCNSTIDFFIKRDKKRRFKYASLQSLCAKKNLDEKYIKDLDTVVLYHNGKIIVKSQAILASLVLLGFPYSLLGILLIIPRQASDIIYSFIGKNRYKLFGKKQTCRLPTEEEKELFLD